MTTTEHDYQTIDEWQQATIERGYVRDVHSVSFATALDNYEPTRAFAHVRGFSFTRDETECYAIDASELKNPTECNYLVDDGTSVRAFYVSGWRPSGNLVMLDSFPVNPNGRTRPDNGRVVDFSTWMLGPRKTYHLKVR